MRFISAIKSVIARIARNLLAAAERLTTQDVLVTQYGEIVIKEPGIKGIADKLSAVLLASAALFFLMSPIQSDTLMAIGDKLMRSASFMWSGGTDGEGLSEEGFATA